MYLSKKKGVSSSIIAVIVVVVIVIAGVSVYYYSTISGPSSSTTSSTTTSTVPNLGTINVGLLVQNYTLYAPWYYGVQHGIFTKLGLTVNIVGYASDSAITTAAAAGQVDLGQTQPLTLAEGVAGGAKFQIVAATFNQLEPGVYLLVAQNSTITTPAQLNGKQIGISSFGSATDFLAHMIFQKYNINFTEVQLGSSSNRATALLTGKIDGIIQFAPPSLSLVSQGHARVVVNNTKDFGSLFNPYTIIFGQPSYISGHADVVKAALKGFFTSVAAMASDQANAMIWFRSFCGVSAAVCDPVFKFEIQNWSTNGVINVAGMSTEISTLWPLAGQSSSIPDISTMYTTEFVPVSIS